MPRRRLIAQPVTAAILAGAATIFSCYPGTGGVGQRLLIAIPPQSTDNHCDPGWIPAIGDPSRCCPENQPFSRPDDPYCYLSPPTGDLPGAGSTTGGGYGCIDIYKHVIKPPCLLPDEKLPNGLCSSDIFPNACGGIDVFVTLTNGCPIQVRVRLRVCFLSAPPCYHEVVIDPGRTITFGRDLHTEPCRSCAFNDEIYDWSYVVIPADIPDPPALSPCIPP